MSEVDESFELVVRSEDEMMLVAGMMAELSKGRGFFFFSGALGVGKTTFCRGLVRHFGFEGAVKSPTFTLVEPYELDRASIYHFDLYRLNDPKELEYIGLEEYFIPSSMCLLEWPEKGDGYLPECDLLLEISVKEGVRHIVFSSGTENGVSILIGLRRMLGQKKFGL